MSIAQEVSRRCYGATAFTLSGGYAVHDGGRRTLFPAGRCELERRNKNGRVTRAEYNYDDGSRLIFTYHPMHGVRLKTA